MMVILVIVSEKSFLLLSAWPIISIVTIPKCLLSLLPLLISLDHSHYVYTIWLWKSRHTEYKKYWNTIENWENERWYPKQTPKSWWSFLKDISRSFEKYWESMNNDLPILYVTFSIFPIIKMFSNLFYLMFTSFLICFSNFYSATVLLPLFFCVLILSQLSNSLTLGSRKKVNGHMHEQRQGVFLYLVD